MKSYMESIVCTIKQVSAVCILIVLLSSFELIDWIYFKVTKKHTKIYDELYDDYCEYE